MLDLVATNPRQNRILAALPALEFVRLQGDLELVTLSFGQVLYRPGGIIQYVYFPTTCIVSLAFTTKNGSSAELAMTGNDGLVGFPLILGGETATHGVTVQSVGYAYRLRPEVLRWELDQGGELLRLCMAYVQALLTRMAQSIVCNRYHTIDQQLCRWLLLTQDQLAGEELLFTQELIASTLGVRREGITEAARRLQEEGLIKYRRGRITVIDRQGLEARACECYQTVKEEYGRLFRLLPPPLLKNRHRPNPANLRRRAEDRLKLVATVTEKGTWDTARLLHELQVHEIELELHNEELRQAYDEVDALRANYADIYDFAPVGYFTLDPLGVILQLNLTGAILLGIKRSQSIRYRFSAFVKVDFLPTFERFHEEVLNGRIKHRCKLMLAGTERRPEKMVSIEAVTNEEGNECRMVVVEVFTEKESANHPTLKKFNLDEACCASEKIRLRSVNASY